MFFTRKSVFALPVAMAMGAALLLTTGCQTGGMSSDGQGGVFGSGSDSMIADVTSISGAGKGNWTTPPPVGSTAPSATIAAPSYSLQPAPEQSAASFYGASTPPPPPPPPPPSASLSDGCDTVAPAPAADPCGVVDACAGDACGIPAAPPAVASMPTRRRCVPRSFGKAYNPCAGLACCQGISQWHIRAVGGGSFFFGDDAPEECSYFGADIGRTFCGCWGLDAYYRHNTGRLDRQVITGQAAPVTQIDEDGGEWHHVGLKATIERPLYGNRLYGWAGVGAGYYWTEGYINDDDGFEGYAEAGIGYMLTSRLRLRAGVNVHAMDTEVTREDPADDGDSRWLFLVAPVLELEATF